MKNQIILSILLIGIIAMSGCLGGKTDITSIAKTLPQVEAFLAEHPNADIKVTLWSESSVNEAIEQIRADCEAPVEIKSYYKITLVESSEKVVVWLDKETNEAVCIIREGSDTVTSVSNSGEKDESKTTSNNYAEATTENSGQVAKSGDKVFVDYELIVDGEQIETTEDSGFFTFTIGSGEVIPGFNDAVVGMEIGETKKVTVSGDNGYIYGPLEGKTLYFTITLRRITETTTKTIEAVTETTKTTYGIPAYLSPFVKNSDKTRIVIGQGQTELVPVATAIASKLSQEATTSVVYDYQIIDRIANPLILLGGSDKNALSAEALGVTFPSNSYLDVGSASIKLIENSFGGSYHALIINGGSTQDVKNAGELLSKYEDYDLKSGNTLVYAGTTINIGSITPDEQIVEETTDDVVTDDDAIVETTGTPEEVCIQLCRDQITMSEDISNGPCLSEVSGIEWNFNDWVCDVAHQPRQSIDDESTYQCQKYRRAEANHFVEVTPNCELIRSI